jgi:hypothetical protein
MPYLAGEYAGADGGEHQQTPGYLDGVADEHDAPFGLGVGKRPHKRRQHHIKQGKHGHQSGTLPLRGLAAAQQLHGHNEQRVVGQRAEKLRRHDGVEAALHVV